MKEKISQNFFDDEIRTECSPCICLSVIFIDSVDIDLLIKIIILKCFQKNVNTLIKKKVIRYITDDLRISSDEISEKENSDKED